jgi:hypothetical protein
VTLPAPGSEGTQARANTQRRGDEDNASSAEACPVAAARMTLELSLADVRDQVMDHERRMAMLAERITEVVHTAGDLDVAAY